MLDVFALLSSSLCILYIVMRAGQLDRTLPWFEREPSPDRQTVSQRSDAAQRGLPGR
jgi:hypothetical protein